MVGQWDRGGAGCSLVKWGLNPPPPLPLPWGWATLAAGGFMAVWQKTSEASFLHFALWVLLQHMRRNIKCLRMVASFMDIAVAVSKAGGWEAVGPWRHVR